MKIGTIDDIKLLSWDGSKKRASDILEARKKVTTRDIGDMPDITPPAETPSLLDQMGVKPVVKKLTADELNDLVFGRKRP